LEDNFPLPFNVNGYSIEELKEIRNAVDEKIASAEMAAKRGEWNTVIQAIRKWNEKYGDILIHTKRGDYNLKASDWHYLLLERKP